MEDEELVHTLKNTPPEVNAEGLRETLCDMKAETLVNALAERPQEGNAETFGDTMGNVKAKQSKRTLTAYNQRRPKQTLRHYAI